MWLIEVLLMDNNKFIDRETNGLVKVKPRERDSESGLSEWTPTKLCV